MLLAPFQPIVSDYSGTPLESFSEILSDRARGRNIPWGVLLYVPLTQLYIQKVKVEARCAPLGLCVGSRQVNGPARHQTGDMRRFRQTGLLFTDRVACSHAMCFISQLGYT